MLAAAFVLFPALLPPAPTMDFIAGSHTRDVREQIACRGSQMWRRLWNGKLYPLSGTSLVVLAAFLHTVGSDERGSETRSEWRA
jgi:hypothetical protein